jgi:hypothetical protein
MNIAYWIIGGIVLALFFLILWDLIDEYRNAN